MLDTATKSRLVLEHLLRDDRRTVANKLPWLRLTDRRNVRWRDRDDGISTGDEAFDSVHVLFAKDQDYAKSAVSASVRAGLLAQQLDGMQIVDDRLFLWRTRRQHDVTLLEDRLRFAATVAADLPAPR